MKWLMGRRPAWAVGARLLSLSALGLSGAGCLSAPPPDLKYDEQAASVEVFRVFCRRVARDAYPTDNDGSRFYAICDGKNADGSPRDPEAEAKPGLRAILRRRPEIMASMERLFAETRIEGTATFDKGELSGFLQALVPLYDKPEETIPTATRGIAQLFQQLTNADDARANKVLDTIARLVQRKGYRPPDQNLGAVRALFTYPRLDKLAQKLLPVISAHGAAHDQWVAVLNAAALELADDAVKVADLDSTTLHTAVGLMLAEDPSQKSGNIPAVPVLQRSKVDGSALPVDGVSGGLPTPFPAIGEDDTAQSRDASGLAQQGGKPVYQTYDASQTLLAALMRELSALIDRGDKPRSALEGLAHGLKPLLGPQIARSETIGKNNYAFTGPDVDHSPLLDLAHIGGLLLQYPETDALLKALDAIIRDHENEATGLDFASMAVAELSKLSDYDNAKLNGPHEFWDDLIVIGERMVQRKGMIEALIHSFEDPRSGAQGKLFATWMRFKDEISYPNSPSTKPEDINADVQGPYMVPVERRMPDVGMNRSIWQRTMSLIHALNGVQVCNKEKTLLNVHTNGLGVLAFPFGDTSGEGYSKCDLVEIPDAVEIFARSVIGKGSFAIKDDFAEVLSVLGSLTGISGSVGEIVESESKIKGFTDTPTPKSLSRFLFAPRNEWLTDMFEPQLTTDLLPIVDYEPNSLFSVEVTDDRTSLDGKAASFLELGVPLITAFDSTESRDEATNKLTDGYMFGNLLSVFHKHWSSRKSTPCPATVEPGNEGCTQSLDPGQNQYSPQTGLVSYEELLATALDEQDFANVLHNAVVALAAVQVTTADGTKINGVKALADFLTRALTPDPGLKKRDGSSSSQSNLCVVDGAACKNGIGRLIPHLSPMVMFADALKRFDDTFKEPSNAERLAIWHQGRSDFLDHILTVDRTGTPGNYQHKLHDRTSYNVAMSVLPWTVNLLKQHRDAGDLATWAEGLSDRAAKVLRHPLAAAIVDLLDAFWPEADASGEFTAVVSYMTDDTNTSSYVGMLTAVADSVTLIDRDPDLSPAIQFASLGLAPNAFSAIDGDVAPNGDKSVAYAGLELTGGVVKQLNLKKPAGTQTALSKLLNNLVLSDGEDRSPLEVLLDAVADVNRTDDTASSITPLTADEDRAVFSKVQSFLYDDDQEKRSLERLYSVIQGRKVK